MGYNRFDPGCCCEPDCVPEAFNEPWNSISDPWVVAGDNVFSIVSNKLQATLPADTLSSAQIQRCFSGDILEDGFTLSYKTTITFDDAIESFMTLNVATVVMGVRPSSGGTFSYWSAQWFGVSCFSFGTGQPVSGDELEIRVVDIGGGNCSVGFYVNGVAKSGPWSPYSIAGVLNVGSMDDVGLGVVQQDTEDAQNVTFDDTILAITY